MIEVGRVCVKIAGKEAGRKCVIVKIIDKNFVLIDGEVKRRRCNIDHLELLPYKIEVSESTPKDEIVKKLKEIFEKRKEERKKKRERKKKKAEEKKKEKKEVKEEAKKGEGKAKGKSGTKP